MTTWRKLHLLISVWSLDSGLICASAARPQHLYYFLYSAKYSQVLLSLDHLHIISWFYPVTWFQSSHKPKFYIFVNYKHILSLSLFSVNCLFLTLLWRFPMNSTHRRLLSHHIYSCLFSPLLSILPSAFLRPAQEKKNTKKRKTQTALS